MRTQLLCTFTNNRALSKTVDRIIDAYDILYNKMFVLKNENDTRELMCTYNIDASGRVEIFPETISLHRKKHSNTLYTINALNECIKNLNNGVLDEKFLIPWENFKNMLMVTNSEGLNKINTRIYKIEKINQ